MMKFSLLSLAILVASIACLQAQFRFDGYRLVRVHTDRPRDIEFVNQWQHDPEFDIWNTNDEEETSKSVTVAFSPVGFFKYRYMFQFYDIKYDIINENVQDLVDEELASMQLAKMNPKDIKAVDIVLKYARFDLMQQFIDQIAAENPSIASTEIIGKSVEGRNLKVITLKTATSSKVVWIDCGIHAREWVSPATCIYFIDRLVKDHKANPATSKLATYEFQILPSVNPDGYEHAHTKYRLWRKNRNLNNGNSCQGVDLNRNYDQDWMVSGASSSPCSDTYAGPSPNSEPETKAVVNKVLNNPKKYEAFFTIHTYGQWILYAWGSKTTPIPDAADLQRVGQAAADAIKLSDGRTYKAGSSSTQLYLNSGSSQDWAYGVSKIKYSYTFELRPGQKSSDEFYGFLLPEQNMAKVAPEVFDGIMASLAAI